MTVPSITNIYPNSGHAGGTGYIRILGGGFGSSIKVTFDGAVSTYAFMIKHALAYAQVPVSPLRDANTGSGAGAVDVVLSNLDSNGDVIPGETVTVANGFTYKAPTFYESHLALTAKMLLREMRRQIISEVVVRRHTDYLASGGVRVELPSLPGIALVGPTIVKSITAANNVGQKIQGERFLIKKRPPLYVDLQFSVVGGASKTEHLLSLLESVLAFFHKNKYLSVDKDPTDSTKGSVSYVTAFVEGGYPAIVSTPNEKNVQSFTGTVGIEGVLVEGFSTIADIPEQDMVNEIVGPVPTAGVTLTTEKKT
jgi:hypothetical protein